MSIITAVVLQPVTQEGAPVGEATPVIRNDVPITVSQNVLIHVVYWQASAIEFSNSISWKNANDLDIIVLWSNNFTHHATTHLHLANSYLIEINTLHSIYTCSYWSCSTVYTSQTLQCMSSFRMHSDPMGATDSQLNTLNLCSTSQNHWWVSVVRVGLCMCTCNLLNRALGI